MRTQCELLQIFERNFFVLLMTSSFPNGIMGNFANKCDFIHGQNVVNSVQN